MRRSWGAWGVLLVAACEVSSSGLSPGVEPAGERDGGPRRGQTQVVADAARGEPKPAPPGPRRDAAAPVDAGRGVQAVDAGGPSSTGAPLPVSVGLPPVVPVPPLAMGPASPPPSPPAKVAIIVRADEIEVRTLRAARVFAKEIDVKSAKIGRLVERRGDKTWERERGNTDVKATQLVADTVYAKEIEADYLEADEVVVEEYDLDD